MQRWTSLLRKKGGNTGVNIAKTPVKTPSIDMSTLSIISCVNSTAKQPQSLSVSLEPSQGRNALHEQQQIDTQLPPPSCLPNTSAHRVEAACPVVYPISLRWDTELSCVTTAANTKSQNVLSTVPCHSRLALDMHVRTSTKRRVDGISSSIITIGAASGAVRSRVPSKWRGAYTPQTLASATLLRPCSSNACMATG
jgi:hypothetical protein